MWCSEYAIPLGLSLVLYQFYLEFPKDSHRLLFLVSLPAFASCVASVLMVEEAKIPMMISELLKYLFRDHF